MRADGVGFHGCHLVEQGGFLRGWGWGVEEGDGAGWGGKGR